MSILPLLEIPELINIKCCLETKETIHSEKSKNVRCFHAKIS
jgi:hypothetical protein